MLGATSMATLEQRVDDDFQAGRLWKARDRLVGKLRNSPSDQWALNRLGEVYFRMGDLPQAGRAWFLTEREGPERQAAEAAFYNQYGRHPFDVVAALRVRAAIDRFPPRVRERLRALQQQLQAEGRFWDPRDRPNVRRSRSWMNNRYSGVIALLLGLVLLIAVVLGLYQIFVYAIRLIQTAA
jgi:hypothetical protein